ncbi:MAG: TIGR03668 family PPOX class F420-dependent oxidoreductase [Actinomycetota bacterium]
MLRLVSAARVARLATVNEKGRPHQVPITFALGDDVVYTAVDAKPKRSRDLERLRNIVSSPHVSVLIDHYSDDWSGLWWCRLDGRARAEPAGPAFDAGIAALQEKYVQYREAPPDGPLIVIDVARWTGWTAADLQEGDA